MTKEDILKLEHSWEVLEAVKADNSPYVQDIEDHLNRLAHEEYVADAIKHTGSYKEGAFTRLTKSKTDQHGRHPRGCFFVA